MIHFLMKHVSRMFQPYYINTNFTSLKLQWTLFKVNIKEDFNLILFYTPGSY